MPKVRSVFLSDIHLGTRACQALSAAKAARALQDGKIGGVIESAGRVVVPARQALNALLEFIE